MLSGIAYLDYLDGIGEFRKADTQSADIFIRLAMTRREALRILGLDESATSEDIRAAYRRAAKFMHPDVNPSPDAEEKFKLINAAYDLLKNEGDAQTVPPTASTQSNSYQGSPYQSNQEESIHEKLKKWKHKYENDRHLIKKRFFEHVLKTDLFKNFWNSKELNNLYKLKTSKYFKSKNPDISFDLYPQFLRSIENFFDTRFYDEYPSASFAPSSFITSLVYSKINKKSINEAIKELLSAQFDDDY